MSYNHDKKIQSDDDWFNQNPNREYRLRRYLQGENIKYKGNEAKSWVIIKKFNSEVFHRVISELPLLPTDDETSIRLMYKTLQNFSDTYSANDFAIAHLMTLVGEGRAHLSK